jgi:hypothetical protein
LSTVTLQPALMQQVEEVAAAQTMPPEQLIETAVRTYLRQIEREQIKQEAQAYQQMHGSLVQQYLHQYVAIYNRQLVDHDFDFETLHARIRQRFGRQPVLLRRVEQRTERELLFRSPHLEQP